MLMNIFEQNLIRLQFKISFCVVHLIKRTKPVALSEPRGLFFCCWYVAAHFGRNLDNVSLNSYPLSCQKCLLENVRQRHKYDWAINRACLLPTLSHPQIKFPI